MSTFADSIRETRKYNKMETTPTDLQNNPQAEMLAQHQFIDQDYLLNKVDMYIINQRPVTCIQWLAVQALFFSVSQFPSLEAVYSYTCVMYCDREMDIDSENDGLFCMLGGKPENDVSECNTSDHLLKCDLHLGF